MSPDPNLSWLLLDNKKRETILKKEEKIDKLEESWCFFYLEIMACS